MRHPGLSTPDPSLVARLSRHVGAVGTGRASNDLGVSRETLARLVAGLPVRAGSLALAQMRADALGGVEIITVDAEPRKAG